MKALLTEIHLIDYIPSEAWRHNAETGSACNDDAGKASDPKVTGDIAPHFNRALADMARKIDWKIQATVQRLILPPGLWRFDTPINWSLLDNRRMNLTIEGCGIYDDVPFTNGCNNATALFFTGGGVPIDFNGRFSCVLKGMTLVGLRHAPASLASLPNPLPAVMVRFYNQGGGGQSRHRIEDLKIHSALVGIQIGIPVAANQHGEGGGDSMSFTRFGGEQCNKFIQVCTEQSVFDSFTRIETGLCPTVVAWDAGGSSFTECSLAQCGDACPPIPARPTPSKETDWVFTFGQPNSIQEGPGNAQHRIEIPDCEGGTGQFINVLGDYKKIELRLNSQAPGSTSPIYHLRGSNSSLKIHDSNIAFGNPGALKPQELLGTSEHETPVNIIDTDFQGKPGPANGQVPLYVRSRWTDGKRWTPLKGRHEDGG